MPCGGRFVFFGDCFNHAGGSATQQCVPKKGVHNGCWMASPQDAERVGANASNGYAPLKSYVTSTITKFKDHQSVVMWEIFNEPQKKNAFSLALRDAGYRWAKAEAPAARATTTSAKHRLMAAGSAGGSAGGAGSA